MVPHWAQLFYLAAATAVPSVVASIPLLASPSGAVSSLCDDICFTVGLNPSKSAKGKLQAFGIVGAMLAISVHLLQNYSLSHPFLLSDNRHFTFYIWNRIIGIKDFFCVCTCLFIYIYLQWIVLRLVHGEACLHAHSLWYSCGAFQEIHLYPGSRWHLHRFT